MLKEQNYDFLARRREVHLKDRRNPESAVAANEIEIDDTWTIAALPEDDPMLKRTVLDLQNYFWVSMNLSLKIAVHETEIPASKVILLEKESENNELTHGIYSMEAGNDYIRICSAESRTVWFAALHLEDIMNLREAPFIEKGSIISKPCLDVREVHSGCGMDEYPDWELNAIAHAGFNTIKLFVKGIDLTAGGYCNINELIRRAAEYGLEVSFHCYLPCFKHPDESGAEEFFDSVYGEFFRHYPDVASISLVGESLEFPSHDPVTTGKKWTESTIDGIPDSRPSPGWWPCYDYGDYLSCIERAIHKANPKVKIYFSTYNWGYASLKLRKNFLENIFPPGIGLKVAFELFADKKINNLSCPVMDYTISNTEGSYYFQTECETAHRLGIETIVTSNTAGATWDFGCVPYVPAPYKWIQRIRTLKKANKEWNIRSFYENHHYGWEPNVVIEFMKFSFCNPCIENPEELLEKLAVRDYGREAAPIILKVWQLWSHAMDHYVASNEDQYGPWRTGPSYPFIFHPNITRTMNSKEIKFPVSEHVYFGSAIIKTFYQPYENVNQSPGPIRFPVEIKELEKMLKLWNEGLQLMHVAMENIYGVKRPAGERLAALGKFIRNSIITTINCKRWWMLNIALQGSDSAELALAILDKLKKIIVSEIKNAEDTLPAVECDSRLGWEPSMGYVCDSWHLKWKVRQMESVLEEIKKYRHTINL